MDREELTPENTPDALAETVETITDPLETLTQSVSLLAEKTDQLGMRVDQLAQKVESVAALEVAERAQDEADEAGELLTPAAAPMVTVGAASAAIDPETMAPMQVPEMAQETPPPVSRQRRGLFRRRLGATA